MQLFYCAIAISVGIGWLCGASGARLLAVSVMAFFAAMGVLVWLELRFFPPPYEPYDGGKRLG